MRNKLALVASAAPHTRGKADKSIKVHRTHKSQGQRCVSEVTRRNKSNLSILNMLNKTDDVMFTDEFKRGTHEKSTKLLFSFY